MKSLGGYFELELNKRNEYHPDALHLNTGRNCLEYILRAKGYKKSYIPYYICEVILEPIKKLNIEYEFYHIDSNFDPVFNRSLNKNEVFLYVNYFGIKENTVVKLKEKFLNNLIVDNSQAFFDKPIENTDTFYSARKFFGLPDGAYLYTDKFINKPLKEDVSFDRLKHLLKRIDLGAEVGYEDFKINDDSLINAPIMQMSRLTKALLCNIDYEKVKSIRKRNFLFLHEKLYYINKFKIDTFGFSAPMVYPFLTDARGLREKLIEAKIFVATYWKNVLNWPGHTDLESNLVKNLLPLPIDQRIDKRDYSQLFHIILNYV
jgi:hypothetical protein